MTIHQLDRLNICILGFGREGQATLRTLERYAPHAHVTVADANPGIPAGPGYTLIAGPNYLEQLARGNFDLIVKSPGVPWRPAGELAGKVTSATQLFLDSLPKGVRTIGVTGTKGKSSTANLIYQALEAGGQPAWLAGNIGEPMLDHLEDARPGATFVLELSSYQLESLHTSPHIAVITSFFPDHLDYHGSLESYFAAKQNITKYQHKGDAVFFNADSAECCAIAGLSPGAKTGFTPADFPATPASAHSIHHAGNLAAAYKVALYCGVAADTAVQALEHAQGLPHRQQSLGVHSGIEWIDDSAATTPQSTEAALSVFGSRIDTIVVGGLNRSYDFTQLGRRLAESAIRNIILFPDTGALIREAVEAAAPAVPKQYLKTSDMTEAVRYAQRHTHAGKICLLSSGSPSYNLFKNYPARGQAFAAAIERLSPAVSD